MSRLVPKLRFKEFSGEWEEKRLGDIYKIFKGKGISKNDITENAKYECIRYGELYTEYREIIKNIKSRTNLKLDNLILSKKNDVIIPSSGETYIDIATAHCVTKDNIALGGDLNILRGNENGIFLAYYLSHTKKYDIAKLAQGIAVVHLYSSQLEKLKLHFPILKEQQKIASTLSSLDSLIEAQNKKVEALKKHKKGLMQQLFPKAGKRVPTLRFDGFSGEWEEKEVGELFQVTRGEVLSMLLTNKTFSQNTPYPVYSSQTKNNGLAGYYSEFLFDDAITWTTDGANAGDVNYRKGKFYCTNVCGVLINKDGYANQFMAELLNTVTRKHVSYIGNPKLMNGVMAKILIPIPTLPEQQKIASCLSSLDSLIEANEQKVEALKKHKKALMQKMFVSGGDR